jgi:hypothetical protein
MILWIWIWFCFAIATILARVEDRLDAPHGGVRKALRDRKGAPMWLRRWRGQWFYLGNEASVLRLERGS